ncbi:MAG: conjugative transposon protein TraM [Pseudobacter sp.]|uniref:conjugative transposon protein TraM n=1 Tax=Pseudobacter sp. TaxID=2045420 RepID=UPI003F7D6CFA
MEKQNEVKHSQKFIRFRKLLLILPVLVLPFLTLAGYSLGVIGKEQPEVQKVTRGFNINLPDARPSADSNWNKMKFYEKADEDSARRMSQVKADPYYAKPTAPVLADTGRYSDSRFGYDPYPASAQRKVDQNEERVMKKLAVLDQEMNRTSAPVQPLTGYPTAPAVAGTDVDRLEKMMNSVTAEDTDPALHQINGLLDKILDVQHPDRIRDKIREQSLEEKKTVFPVSDGSSRLVITSMGKADTSGKLVVAGSGFYGLESTDRDDVARPALRATIASAQTLVNGSTVEMMLNDDAYVAGVLIPKHTFIYGVVALNGDRLQINVSSIQYRKSIFPVALSVYDLDGMEGVFIPGSITRDVSKQSTEQAIQGLGIASLDPSLGAQAASAGIEAAKSLIGKKTRLVRVNVGKGYEVLLFDKNGR